MKLGALRPHGGVANVARPTPWGDDCRVCSFAPQLRPIVQRCAFIQTHRSITPARCSDGLDTRPPWRTDACSSGAGPARFRHRAGHSSVDATFRALHVLAHQLQRCCGRQHMPGTDCVSRAISNMGSHCTLGPGSYTQALMCACCALRRQRLHPPACGTFLLPWHVVQRLCMHMHAGSISACRSNGPAGIRLPGGHMHSKPQRLISNTSGKLCAQSSRGPADVRSHSLTLVAGQRSTHKHCMAPCTKNTACNLTLMS